MVWVRPSDENDMTSAEFDAFIEKCDENVDYESLRAETVWVDREDLFEHTDEEYAKLERRNS